MAKRKQPEGYSLGFAPPDPEQLADQVNTALNAGGEAVTAAQGQLRANAAVQMAKAETTLNGLQGEIRRPVDQTLDYARRTLSDLYGPIQTTALEGFGRALQTAGSVMPDAGAIKNLLLTQGEQPPVPPPAPGTPGVQCVTDAAGVTRCFYTGVPGVAVPPPPGVTGIDPRGPNAPPITAGPAYPAGPPITGPAAPNLPLPAPIGGADVGLPVYSPADMGAAPSAPSIPGGGAWNPPRIPVPEPPGGINWPPPIGGVDPSPPGGWPPGLNPPLPPCPPGWWRDQTQSGAPGNCNPPGIIPQPVNPGAIPQPPVGSVPPPPQPPYQPPYQPPPPPATECPKCPVCDKPKTPEEPSPGQPGEIKHEKNNCTGVPDATIFSFGSLGAILPWLFGLTDEKGTAKKAGWTSIIPSFGINLGTVFGTFWTSFWGTVFGPFSRLLGAITCGGQRQTDLQGMLLLYSFIGKWVGWIPRPLTRPIEQQSNELCPTDLPGPAEATAAYLADEISEETWRCWTRSAGVLDKEAECVRNAARSKLSAFDLVSLARRGGLHRGPLTQRLRELGFTDRETEAELFELTKALPGIGDILRFLVRDVADPNAVARFRMDEDFQNKWQGSLIEWAKAQGIPDEVALYYWRAHWELPSPTQLYEMLHRLSRLPQGDPARVDLADVRAALQQADVLPFWVDRFLAISYRPLTRVDVRRMRALGALSKADVKEAYLQLGYDDANADRLAEFVERDIAKGWVNGPVAKLYLQWSASLDELNAELAEKGADPQQASYTINKLNKRRDQLRRRACQKGWKRRYLIGEWDDAMAVQVLVQSGLDNASAGSLVGSWRCERDARGKTLAASQLCKLTDEGILTVNDMYARLLKIGYQADDASALVRSCQKRIQLRIDTEELKRLKEQEANAKAQRGQMEKLANKAEAERAKAEKRRQAATKREEGAERNLLTAAVALAPKLEIEPYDALEGVRAITNQLSLQTSADRYELAAASVTVAKSPAVSSWEAFEKLLTQFGVSGRHEAGLQIQG